MERRRLGESGVEVPAAGLGTWQVLDVRKSEAESRHKVIRAALAEGANLFDSSPVYGEAERELGDALRKPGRERAIFATTSPPSRGGWRCSTASKTKARSSPWARRTTRARRSGIS